MNRSRTAGVVALVVALLAVTVWGLSVWRPFGIDHPDEWDDRVAALVDDVEDGRDLEFEHPVSTRFVPEDEFVDLVTTDVADLTDDDRQELEITEAELRAFGLLTAGDDLFEQSNTASGAGTLAFYDPSTQEIVIRGTELDVATRSTVVHELTHALQDQHFDLERLERKAARSAATGAVRGVIEGDASLVEQRWLAGLSEDDREAYFEQLAVLAEGAEAGTADVNPVLLAAQQAPYRLGLALVSAVRAEEGATGVDELFERPPANDEHLLRPISYLDGDEAEDVPAPHVPARADELGEAEPLGPLVWYLVLASALEPTEALAIADGWGGDSSRTYRDDDLVCARTTLTGEDEQATDAFEQGLETWLARRPAGTADVERDGDVLTLTACDLGPAAVEVLDEDAVELPFLRADLVSGLAPALRSAEAASCTADRLLAEVPLELLLRVNSGEATDDEVTEFQEQAILAASGCQ